MFQDGRRRVDDRLVSIAQPHIRPIKRGKGGGKDTEFGPKINVGIMEGFIRADQIDFNAFNEANLLCEQIESYHTLLAIIQELYLLIKATGPARIVNG